MSDQEDGAVVPETSYPKPESSKDLTTKRMMPTDAREISASSPSPLSPEPPHLQNYYRHQYFRLLLALIIVLSLSNMAYVIALSLLYDIDWAYIALIASVSFSVGQVVLWAIRGVVWGHCRDSFERVIIGRRLVGVKSMRKVEWIIGWLLWLVMVGVNVFVKVWLDTTS